MHRSLSRRQLLAATSAAAGILAAARRPALAATPATRLTVERRTLEVNGRAASVFGIRQPDGTHGLILDPGQRFRVDLENRAGEEAIIHWHGQIPPNAQDGVADAGRPMLAAGGTRVYDYAARSGTHWMHSHHGLQEQLLMAAPLVVRSAEDLRADVQEVTVLLHDFTFRDPAEIFAGLAGGHGMNHGAMNHGAPADDPHAGHAMPGADRAAMPAMDLNDVEYDAYLANDRTLADPLVVRTERGGQVRLRLINGATATAFHIDIGAVDGTLVAVDGNPVRPVPGRRFPIAMAQRLDIVLTMPDAAVPVLAQREGDRARTGIVLAPPGVTVSRVADLADAVLGPIDLSLESRLVARVPLVPRSADLTHRLMLTGAMAPYVWSLDDRTWGQHRPITVRRGQRVVLEMMNHTSMAHPMHLHGHHFQVVAINGAALSGAVRDTVLVPLHGTVTVAFDAAEPGRWPLHCHNLYHMAAGMMTEVVSA